MTNILHYEVDSKFVDRCEEINNAEHNETMSEMIGTYDDGCYIYFDAFDKKDGGYCQYVLYDKEGHELGFTDPLNEDEVIDEFELDDNHKLIVKVREIEESLKEAQEGFTTFLNLECGVLLKEDDPEFKDYSVAYDHKHGYYDETYLNGLDKDKDYLKEVGLQYIKDGVNGTYAILTSIDVQGTKDDDFIQDAIKNIEDGWYIDNSIDFLDNEQFKASNVIWSAYKNDNGEIIENFVDTNVDEGCKKEVEESLKEEDEIARVEYCVMDKDNNNIECFNNTDDAIAFAKENEGIRVLEVQYGPKDEHGDEPELGTEEVWSIRESLKEDEGLEEEKSNKSIDKAVRRNMKYLGWKHKHEQERKSSTSNNEVEMSKEESLEEEYNEDDLIDLGEDEVPMTFGELVEIMENRLLREDTLVENLEEVAIKYAKDFIRENNGTKIKKEAKR